MQKRLLRLIWLALLACVVAGSLLASDSAPKRALDQWFDDKLIHVAAYLALMAVPAVHESRSFTTILAVALAALSLTLECAQRAVPGRSFDAWDVAANTVGLLCGLAVAGLLRPGLARMMRRRGASSQPG